MNPLDRLKELTSKISSYELTRKENIKRLKELFYELELDKKVFNFEMIFDYKAINLSAVSLQKENFAEITEGKYFQLLAITKVEGKTKNISLAYYGRVENVDKILRQKVIEFVIRYRFEKSFINLENYYELLDFIKQDD
jgi:predicted aldo/keto reductase-like oxidoreductase